MEVEDELEEIKIDEQNERAGQQRSTLNQNHRYSQPTEDQMQVEEQDGVLSCYQNDVNIVYGTAHFFQADILKHEFYKKGNRGSRKFDKIIVDEVDSMLVDSRNHRTLLASEQSGFNKIMTIIQMIWIELCNIESLVDPKTLKKRIVNQYQAAEEDASVHLIRTIVVFLGDKNTQNSFTSSLQSFLIEYINYKLPVWAINAVKAKYQFTKNVQYIVKNEKILPIDYQHTGVTQINTQYQDGIHQFLQLKENLPLSNLNLVTNYSSNINFFRRYESNLYGLTGTLGTENIRNFLNETYRINFVYIPPFKKRLLTELFPYLEEDKQKWIKKVAQDVEWACVEQHRCCLVISKTIKDVNEIYNLIINRKAINSHQIYKYTDSEDNQSERKIQKYTKPGCVILSTNLAGRGCDLKIPEIVEQKGGLHVIVTFIPENSRVLEQAFGRAGRQGQKGSARIVIESGILKQLKKYLLIEDDTDGEYFKQQFSTDLKCQIFNQVEEEERYQISIAKEEVKKIEEQDDLFYKFSNKINSWNIRYQEDHLSFRALEFRFGMFLDILNEKQKDEIGNKSLSDFMADTEQFFSEIQKDYEKGKIIIKSEDLLYKSCFSLMNKDGLATEIIEQAKNMDQYNPIPHYQQILSYIQNKDFDNIQSEYKQFKEKVEVKKEEHSILRVATQNSYQIAIQQLSNQLDQEINLLNNMKIDFAQQIELPNIQPIEFEQIQNRLNQNGNQNLSQLNHLLSNQVQPQQQQYIIQQLKQEQIENQKKLVKELEFKLDQLKKNSTQLEINLSKDEKHLQIYDAISKQLEENLEQLNKINGQKGYEISVEFEKGSELKTYMPDYDSAFKDIRDLEQMLANDGLPLIGKVQTKKKKKKFLGWIAKLVVGVVQIIVGSALTYFSCGAASSIGIGLIFEGCVDVFQSIKAAINNEDVDLGQYFKNKLISLSLTCTLAGSQALAETGQLFKQGAEYAAKNGILNSTKKLLSSEVILGGLKKAGQKAIELNNIKMLGGLLSNRLSQTDIRQESQETKQEINEEQKQNFNKKLEQIKNSQELKNQFISIQRKETQYEEFLEQIRDEIEMRVDQKARLNYSDILTQLVFLIKSNPENTSAIENLINNSYMNIDSQQKDKIFEQASSAIVQANFNKLNALNNLTPCLEQLLNELFKKIDEKLKTQTVSIFQFILKETINQYARNKQQQIDDSKKNFELNQNKFIKESQDQRQIYEQDVQNLNNEQQLLKNDYQNIQQKENQLINMRQNLNQYDQNAVNNYNQQLQQINQQIENYTAKQQQFQSKVQQIENNKQILLDQVKYKNDMIKKELTDLNNHSSSIAQEISNLNLKIQGQQFEKKYQDTLLRLQVFKSDNITLNPGFQNKASLQNELTNLFDNCQFSKELVNYIFSPQFQAEQTQIQQNREKLIQYVIQKTNDRVIMPMLQQSLNKLIKKDIQIAESEIKLLAEKINKNK
ncbi:hypothetical protein ABPG72_013792 [Tetrahymena utriculariae]